ncbi:pyridoxal 5'-phosphate synthase [Pseudoalteromonas luteoviolacea]|uniref:pyridoxine/pyridoxamine 5'-phosphate oxidase n=1 Tax=Pseudoalteromonas luteoviolacea TaxID=43657 RepID=UPI001B38920C|nr:pyridoxal 5'-phosphate synthase [Pseudoalteromonas luteoviolacea]MBQ4812829.1 pyridoxal 5'-phosphate synthase [Pseudoalteromonas luteoviolacea]
MSNPIDQFLKWWERACVDSPLRQRSAVCVSTIDRDGFPAARFVDLKSVSNEGIVFCTYLDSAKGKEINHCNKVALTAWWDHVGYQVRVTGRAYPLSEEVADRYWKTRTRDAQITTHVCEQSQPLKDPQDLYAKVEEYTQLDTSEPSVKPTNWGGYAIEAHRIEFLTFKEDRLHLRELFTLNSGVWSKSYLQP